MICRRAFYLPAALCLSLTACQRPSNQAKNNPEFIQLEGERLSRAQREELLRMRYDRLAGPHEEAAAIFNQLESQRASVTTLSERKEELEREVTALRDQKDNLRRTALRAARERAVGKQLPELTLANGRTLKQVTVTGGSEAGIQVRHATGTARLDVNDLGPVRSELYGLDPELQANAVAREETERQAYERWIERELSTQAVANEPAKPVRERRTPKSDLLEVSASSTSATASTANARSNPLHEKPRYFGGVRSRPRYVYYYYYRPYSPSPRVITPENSASILYPDPSQ
jgi:hypothetical protein